MTFYLDKNTIDKTLNKDYSLRVALNTIIAELYNDLELYFPGIFKIDMKEYVSCIRGHRKKVFINFTINESSGEDKDIVCNIHGPDLAIDGTILQHFDTVEELKFFLSNLSECIAFCTILSSHLVK
jgi:hypothetical protein